MCSGPADQHYDRISTEQGEFRESPTVYGRRYLRRRTQFWRFSDPRGEERQDKLPREQHMASGQKRRWESCARQFWAMTALQLGTHPAYDGGWSRFRQPWDVIELFSTDASVSLAVLSAGGRATQPYDGGLGNSLRTSTAQEQMSEDVGSWKPRLTVAYLTDWTPVVSELAREFEVSDQFRKCRCP